MRNRRFNRYNSGDRSVNFPISDKDNSDSDIPAHGPPQSTKPRTRSTIRMEDTDTDGDFLEENITQRKEGGASAKRG